MPLELTEEQVAFFHRQGYLILPRFWDEATVSRLRSRIDQIVSGYGDLSTQEAAVFTTNEQSRDEDDYFLSSGGKVSFFWGENSRDSEGNWRQSPAASINKIGHALQDLDPVFEAVSYTPRIGGICRDLGIERPLSVQSMYIFKQPRIGGEVSAHQDGAFLYTEPQSVLGFWWALDDCTTTNGCLWVVPGSHTIPVSRKFRRKAGCSGGTEFYPPEPVHFSLEGSIPVECSKGTLVLIHSALVHYSEENKSDRSRHAYTLHVVDGSPGVIYPEDNWLQRPAHLPFRHIEFNT